MLDAVVDFLPSPLEVPPMVGHKPNHEEVEVVRHSDAAEPFAALAFKVVAHPFFGRLTYVRVYSVSYTHLDVYKRQQQGRRGPRDRGHRPR